MTPTQKSETKKQDRSNDHTPIPWRVNNLYPSSTFGAVVEGHDGAHITDYIHLANAAFIVRAVNSHDELVAVCEKLARLAFRDPGRKRPNELDDYSVAATLIEEVKAALSRATDSREGA